MNTSKELIKQVMRIHNKNQKQKPEQANFNATKEALVSMIQSDQLDIGMQEFNKIAYDLDNPTKPIYDIKITVFLLIMFLLGMMTLTIGIKVNIDGLNVFGSALLGVSMISLLLITVKV